MMVLLIGLPVATLLAYFMGKFRDTSYFMILTFLTGLTGFSVVFLIGAVNSVPLWITILFASITGILAPINGLRLGRMAEDNQKRRKSHKR